MDMQEASDMSKIEVWERRKYPAMFGTDEDNPVRSIRKITYDARGNVTLTRQEIEGLMNLANYEKREQ